MPPRRRTEPQAKPTRRLPATTPDGREMQLVSMAVDLAEQQILGGTASAQVISHYLKLGSSRERLEQERLRQENNLLRAKVEDLVSRKEVGELYEQALRAMRTYGGHEPTDPADEYDG